LCEHKYSDYSTPKEYFKKEKRVHNSSKKKQNMGQLDLECWPRVLDVLHMEKSLGDCTVARWGYGRKGRVKEILYRSRVTSRWTEELFPEAGTTEHSAVSDGIVLSPVLDLLRLIQM
jgi:hypothetical protein